MANLFGMEKREVIRIKVKKCEGMLQPEYKKMSVDPELTSFDILIRLLAKAFNIKGSFTVSYLAKDDLGQDVYLSLLSDWDLDAAFFSASDPYLRLEVDLRPFEEGPPEDHRNLGTDFVDNYSYYPRMEDWDVVAPTEVATNQQNRSNLGLDRASFLGSLTGSLTAHVGKTVSQVSKAMGLKQEEQQRYHLAKPPMTDPEFRYFMDAVGHMVRPDEFRLMVYQGGVEPSLRSVVWRHLLNVYPEGLSGRERFDYQKKKCNEYYKLRDEWKDLFSKGRGTEEMRFIANMVKKDVLRTDRAHKVYAGSDDSANVLSLFNILATYAITHPDVSYCQGMSDLASPILVVETDEATAYLCFCGLMKRLRKNFTIEGKSMSRMFEHLALVLHHRDPDFYAYLQSQSASDMFFTYRWLLLELKREFPLDDALLMLEVMWSSLPPDPPEDELELADPEYSISKLICSPQSPSIASLSKNYLRIKSLCRHVQARPEQASDAAGNVQAPTEGSHAPASHIPSRQLSSHSTAITPAEEVKNINPEDFLPVEDSSTKELLDKSSSIDESLMTKPGQQLVQPAAGEKLQNRPKPQPLPTVDHSNDIHITGKVAEIKIEETKDQGDGNISSAEGRTPPSSPKRPDTIQLKKTFEPLHKSNGQKTQEAVRNPQENDHQPLTQKKPEAAQSTALQEPQSTVPDDKAQSESRDSSNQSTPRRVRQTLVLTENGVAEETMVLNSCEEATEHPSIDFIKVQEKLPKLPPPHEFGDGNPFLMFLCLTLLVQERDHIVQNGMDYNELAMHFDKMVRQHNVHKVLHQAQSLYAVYLRAQTMANSDSSEDVSV